MPQTKSKISVQQRKTHARPGAFKKAHEAVKMLWTLTPLLSSKEEETLAILIDKELVSQLDKSLNEVRESRTEPLKNILK